MFQPIPLELVLELVAGTAEATAAALQQDSVQRVGLLGTAFTMELDFYRQRIADHGIEVVVPDLHDRQIVHDIIYQELCQGQIDPDSRDAYLAIIDRLAEAQIEGVILGCTEIGLLIKQQHTGIRLYDTTEIHARKADDLALDPHLTRVVEITE